MSTKYDFNLIEEQDGFVNLRNLYQFLGLNLSNWSRWYRTYTENQEFIIEGVDYIKFTEIIEGNEVVNFKITTDYAKRLCLLVRTIAGQKARNYFIESEKLARQMLKAQNNNPNTIEFWKDLHRNNLIANSVIAADLKEVKEELDQLNTAITNTVLTNPKLKELPTAEKIEKEEKKRLNSEVWAYVSKLFISGRGAVQGRRFAQDLFQKHINRDLPFKQSDYSLTQLKQFRDWLAKKYEDSLDYVR